MIVALVVGYFNQHDNVAAATDLCSQSNSNTLANLANARDNNIALDDVLGAFGGGFDGMEVDSYWQMYEQEDGGDPQSEDNGEANKNPIEVFLNVYVHLCRLAKPLLTLCRRKPKRFDNRTRRDRTQRANEAWSMQYPALVNALLVFEHEGAPVDPECLMHVPIHVIGLLGRETVNVPVGGGQGLTIALARHGFMGTSPLFPSTAISFEALRVYHSTSSRCPSLSIQAYTHALCDLHHVRLVCALIALTNHSSRLHTTHTKGHHSLPHTTHTSK